MIAGKVWGTTELLERNGVLEFHRIVTKKGGVCSKHLHEYKWNGFFVESGSLLIRGDYTKVKPGLLHQFESLEDCVAYELYWAEFPEKDIQRETVGHI